MVPNVVERALKDDCREGAPRKTKIYAERGEKKKKQSEGALRGVTKMPV